MDQAAAVDLASTAMAAVGLASTAMAAVAAVMEWIS